MVTAITDKTSDAAKLARSAAISDKKLEGFRKKRAEFMKHFAGRHYGDNSEISTKMPLNLMYSVGCILEPLLALRRVKTGVTSYDPEASYFADSLRLTVNHVARKIKAAWSIREAIRDSFGSMGIVKTGFATGGKFGLFVEAISLDDYIIDHRTRTRKPGSYAYEGHRFRMPFEVAMESGLFNQAQRGLLEDLLKRQTQDHSGKADEIATGKKEYSLDEFDPQIELCELYIPRRNSVVWLAGDLREHTHYIREFGWRGHEDGPIDVLGYSWLNENPVPVPLYAVIYDLYLLENELARKIGRQAQQQKDFVTVPPNSEDAETVRKVHDGEVIQVSDSNGVQAHSLGGGNEKGYAAVAWFHDWLNRISGNTEIVGGLRANEKTLGQSQIELSKASVRVNDMRGFVTELVENVCQKLGWYIWHDPKLSLRLTQRLPGGVELPMQWSPDVRVGQFDNFEFSLSAYSRQSDSPEDQYERVMNWMERVVLPIAPLAAQQGSRLNVDVLANATGRDLDLPEIDDLWEESEPLENPAMMGTPQGRASGEGGPRVTSGRQPPLPIESMGAQAVGAGAAGGAAR